MEEDKMVKKYFENLTYGNESLSSEIHGPKNQETINKMIASLVRNYDRQMEAGNKDEAGKFKSMIYQISTKLDNLKVLKQDFARYYGGGTGGKKLFSNWTDLQWDRMFFTENGEILFDSNLHPILSVVDPDGNEIVKGPEDVTENWVIKGTEENDYMRLQQSCIKQRNNQGKELDFDIDWELSKLFENEAKWKVFVSDKIGGRYFLNDYVQQHKEAIESGQVPDDMLHPESFNPAFDTRLHHYYATRLRKAFNPNYQTPEEARKADALIAKNENTVINKTTHPRPDEVIQRNKDNNVNNQV